MTKPLVAFHSDNVSRLIIPTGKEIYRRLILTVSVSVLRILRSLIVPHVALKTMSASAAEIQMCTGVRMTTRDVTFTNLSNNKMIELSEANPVQGKANLGIHHLNVNTWK